MKRLKQHEQSVAQMLREQAMWTKAILLVPGFNKSALDVPDLQNVEPERWWRDDYKCGPLAFLPEGLQAKCDPDSDSPCCNTASGWCGQTPDHCKCKGNAKGKCIDYRLPENRPGKGRRAQSAGLDSSSIVLLGSTQFLKTTDK